MKKHKKKFLKLPEYPGGKEAFKKYILKNLKYPKEALQKRIEGIVYLSAEIDDKGNVESARVENGIGGGCDNEAIRLLKNVQFTEVKNRGFRVKTKKKFRIEFKLPKQNKVIYNVTKEKKPEVKTKSKPGYSYTININTND